MWIVIHMAKGEDAAGPVANLLKEEGILTKTRAVYRNLPPNENYYEILVLQSEAEEAREVLLEKNI